MGSFKRELRVLINCHNKEKESNTPDFILATYLMACLRAFDAAMEERERWYGREGRVAEKLDYVPQDLAEATHQ